MPIEIKQLHIKSSVTQRAAAPAATPAAAGTAAPAPAGGAGCCDGGGDGAAASGEREQTLAACRRMIRDAMRELRER